jgi:hypothetical protein
MRYLHCKEKAFSQNQKKVLSADTNSEPEVQTGPKNGAWPSHDRLQTPSACLCLSFIFLSLACLPVIFFGLPVPACRGLYIFYM